MTNLRSLSLAGNNLSRVQGVDACPLLEEVDLEDNAISQAEGFGALALLRRLDLGRNRLTSLAGLEPLPALEQLSVEDNALTSIQGLQGLPALMELYLANNRIPDLKELSVAKELGKLIILDASGNPLCADEEYRPFALYFCRRLKVLDGKAVDTAEQAEARERFAGKLTPELLEERAGEQEVWAEVQSLDLSGCKLRELALVTAQAFPAIKELRAQGNHLTDLASLGTLPQLRVLDLSANALGSSPATPVTPAGAVGRANAATAAAASRAARGAASLETLGSVSVRLERLNLSSNQIPDLGILPLRHLGALRILNLAGNDLVRLQAGSLAGLSNLGELGLEKNRLRLIEADAFAPLASLAHLRLDDNQLRSLDHLRPLPLLEYLWLNNNRVADVAELDRLSHLTNLRSVSAQGNPVARKQLYRPTLIRRLQNVEAIDGRSVTSDERERVELVFAADQRASALPGGAPPPSKVALKLTAMQFDLNGPAGLGPVLGNAPFTNAGCATAAGTSSGVTMGTGSSAMPSCGAVGVGVMGVGIGGNSHGVSGGARSEQFDSAGPQHHLRRGSSGDGSFSGGPRRAAAKGRPSSTSRRAPFAGPGGGATNSSARSAQSKAINSQPQGLAHHAGGQAGFVPNVAGRRYH